MARRAGVLLVVDLRRIRAPVNFSVRPLDKFILEKIT